MGNYSNFNDTPEQIKYEGQEISINFKNNGDGTGTVTWNIPKPYGGCKVEHQAYNGIIVTISKEPAKFPQTSPIDAQYYAPDNTANYEASLADQIGGSYVVGAFYSDKTTTSLIVTDVNDNQPYYVSGYAVDKQGRYHTEGVHAYALPFTKRENKEIEYSASQCIIIDKLGESNLTTNTGLTAGTDYTFNVKVGCDTHTITVNGTDAQTYEDLVNIVNDEFSLLTEGVVISSTDPTIGEVYKDGNTFKIWNGTEYQEPLLTYIYNSDPNIATLTEYNLQNGVLQLGGNVVDYISYYTDPTTIEPGTVWFDDTVVRVLEGSVWCDYETITSTRNPLLAPLLTHQTYWYNPDNDEINKWNVSVKKWDEIEVIYSDFDPNNILDGFYWIDLENQILYTRSSGSWNKINHLRVETSEPSSPMALSFWFNPDDNNVYRRNLANTEWELITNIYKSYYDPANRESCDLWWNSNVSVDDLYVWDNLNSQWVLVSEFYKTNRDPALPPENIAINTAWYNPDTNEVKLLADVNCTTPNSVLFSSDDPLNLPSGAVWNDTSEDKWYEFDGSDWSEFTPILVFEGEGNTTTNIYWYNPDTEELKDHDYMNTNLWIDQEYSTTDVRPQIGDLWFNDNTKELYEGDGTKWVDGYPFVSLFFIDGDCKNYDKLCFRTKEYGCKAELKIVVENDNLFSHLDANVIYEDARQGKVTATGRIMYRQTGVGDSGDPTVRRELHNQIRSTLGHPGTQVELDKVQVDICIENALLKIRKYSSFGYKRGFFFLNMHPNQQHYYLTDKCVGFNKITEVRAIYRMRSGFMNGMKGSGFDSDMFGFAAFQQLYSMGSFDLLSYHLVSSYVEDLQRMFADHIMFQFKEEERILKIYQSVYKKEKVLVDAYIERTEQDLISNRETRDWIKRWAVAEAKMMLSQIRGKYQSLPGPGGNTVLNSQELITQAENEKADLLEELSFMGMQDIVDTGMASHFIIG